MKKNKIETKLLNNQIDNICYLLELVKVYDFLERLESTTKDSGTENKIRDFLQEQKVWDK